MLRIAATVLAGVLACVPCGTAHAADSAVFYDPVLPDDFSTPSYFEGFYAGVLIGAAGNAHGNFFPSGGIARGEVGAFAGRNFDVMPGVVAGGEVMIAGQSDFTGTYSSAALVLGQVGRLVEDKFAFFLVGGGGVFGSAPALAFGLRAEMGVYDNLSMRAEMLNLVQAGPSSGGITIPGVTGQMLNVGVLWHMGEGASTAQGLLVDLEPAANLPNFDGLYAGGSFGLHHNPANNFFPDVGFGAHPTRSDIGAFLGWNYRFNEWLVAGVEGQAGLLFDTSGDVGFNAFGLGRLGVTPWDGTMFYGLGGLGVVQGKPAVGAGGGVEYAAFDDASLRGEALVYGELGGTTISSSKYSAGVVWHMN